MDSDLWRPLAHSLSVSMNGHCKSIATHTHSQEQLEMHVQGGARWERSLIHALVQSSPTSTYTCMNEVSCQRFGAMGHGHDIMFVGCQKCRRVSSKGLAAFML
jgi:hypothetical protein